MNIVEFIEKLRDKPRAARVRILWLSVFVCMALILFFWVIAFDHSAKNVSNQKSDFDSLSAGVGSSVKDIKNQWPQVRAGIEGGVNSLFDNQTSTEANPFNE